MSQWVSFSLFILPYNCLEKGIVTYSWSSCAAYSQKKTEWHENATVHNVWSLSKTFFKRHLHNKYKYILQTYGTAEKLKAYRRRHAVLLVMVT